MRDEVVINESASLVAGRHFRVVLSPPLTRRISLHIAWHLIDFYSLSPSVARVVLVGLAHALRACETISVSSIHKYTHRDQNVMTSTYIYLA